MPNDSMPLPWLPDHHFSSPRLHRDEEETGLPFVRGKPLTIFGQFMQMLQNPYMTFMWAPLCALKVSAILAAALPRAAVCGGKGPDNIQAVHANVAEPAYDIHAGPPVCPQNFCIICGSPPKGS
ncbi:hypothetical protein BDN67DRAFT_1016245 [Paxillus ammoniavirescens]|nr:hypothetical protein BDN67DRAFT_1016245 [Paxillus ammoniavirescens]